MLPPLDAVVAIWRARLPDAVGTPATQRRPLLPVWPFLLIAAAAGVFTATAAGGVQVGPLGAVLGGIVVAVPVAVAHWRPGVAVACCAVMNVLDARFASVFSPELSVPPWFLNALPAQVLTAFGLGIALPGRLAAVGVGGIAAGGLASVAIARPAWTGPLLPAAYWIALLIAAALLGAASCERHRQTLLRVGEGERTQVRAERDRIAREMHDVVAHHMSVIAVRSVSASRRIADLPGAAVTEFDELGAAAREALGEMRQLLGMLDADGSDVADREPQPGLADLRRIVERTRSAGTPVELVLREPAGVPAAVAVSTYRIVQEALSNVTRHATGAPTVVRVGPDGSGDQLVIEVDSGPAPAPAAAGAGSGRGMIGMRERARLLGGTFDAGATPGGGFAVRVELPLRGAS